MAEQFHLEFASSEASRRAELALGDLFLDDQPLMLIRRENETNLFCGCAAADARLIDRQMTRRSDGMRRPFAEIFYMIHTMRSGEHDPRGLLWIGTGHHRVAAESVSILDIAPTILRHFGVPQPEYMEGKPIKLEESPQYDKRAA